MHELLNVYNGSSKGLSFFEPSLYSCRVEAVLHGFANIADGLYLLRREISSIEELFNLAVPLYTQHQFVPTHALAKVSLISFNLTK